MNIFRAFRRTSLILFFFFIFTGSPADIHADTTNARSPASPLENRLYVNLKEFKSIHIPANPDQAAKDMAQLLQKRMASLYKVTVKIKTGLPDRKETSILVGREHALSSGIVTKEELNSVKLDGYVIKGTGNRIVIAGYAPQGTVYGTYAFLRLIGLKIYPWHHSPNDSIEVFTPLKNEMLGNFSISSKPYFEYRDMLDYLDRGRFGGTMLRYALADLRFAQEYEHFKDTGYLNWDHSAGYLVPLQRYYDDHPEYFSMKNGRRIPKSTRNHNVSLCMCNPDVVRISTERALGWMDIQKDRRYFAITDGDSAKPQCPQCAPTDPIPDYYTDRLLKWVNAVASSVRLKYPEKILLTAAYQNTVKPPVDTKLEPNVLVMYAPWYWTSRTTSAVGFAHPLNVVAMEEFAGWSTRFPGQIGIYDYPGAWVHGTSERIKFFAKNKVGWLHFNGPRGNLLHWVNSQLLWDPTLDADELESEFVQAFYGPAAEVMGKYLQLLKQAISANSWYSDKFFREPVSLHRARSLLYEAETIAESTDLSTQTRILEGVTEGLYAILKNAHPMHSDLKLLKNDFEHFMRLNRRVIMNCRQLKIHKTQMETRRRFLKISLEELGVTLPDLLWRQDHPAEQEEIVERSILEYDRILARLAPAKSQFRTTQDKYISFPFIAPNEHKKWRAGSSQTNLVIQPVMATADQPSHEKLRGLKISAPLSRLPVLPRGNIKVHAGRFYAERTFDPPLDTDGSLFLDFRLHASRDVPVTIYINNNTKLRSDVVLHAGEQIVRIDLRNYDANLLDSMWPDKRIKSIGFDIWPQDNFYPYPEVQDADILFFGLEAKNSDPAPALLPHRGKAIWMTHFRANVPHATDAFDDSLNRHRRLATQDTKYKFYTRDIFSGWKSEKFRTFTEHRIASPIFAILTDKDSLVSDEKAARALQKYLLQAYGVELPINPPGLSVGPHAGNVIILGSKAALATGKMHPAEFKHVGTEGFVINARNGRIIIAGGNGNGTFFGVVRYLEEHGLLFLIPGVREVVPDMRDNFLHEIYLLDWPYFKNRQIQCGDLLMAQSAESPWNKRVVADNNGINMAKRAAIAIKNNASSGINEIPEDVYSYAEKSPMSCYVASKLLWNPFADASRLIKQFER